MTSIKINYNGEFRRLPLPSFRLSYAELKEKASTLFPELKGRELTFSWVDGDGDNIKLYSDEELQDAIGYMANKSQSLVKFDVSITSSSSKSDRIVDSDEKIIHTNIRCDQCNTFPIVGVRYKCSVREDFDLCEKCESVSIQPYPMIKIYHPDQNPFAIMIAIRDESEQTSSGPFGPGPRFGPRHGHHRGMGHPHGMGHPRGRHPHGIGHPFFGKFGPPPAPQGPAPQGPAPQGPAPQGPGPHPHHFPFSHEETCPPHRLGHWARCAKAFVDVMKSSDTTSNTSTTAHASRDGKNDLFTEEAAEVEQKIIEEAIRMSIQESSTSIPTATATTTTATATTATATPFTEVEPAPVQTTVSSKPKARFVKDVTFPDGTVVQPGTHFLKVWRIRNDGAFDWSADNVIIPAGGDELTDSNLKVSLPAIPAGQEADITVELTAPQRSGRHVAYFRLQSADGSNFGHRLWADIRVADDEVGSLDWQVVSGVLHDSMDLNAEETTAVHSTTNNVTNDNATTTVTNSSADGNSVDPSFSSVQNLVTSVNNSDSQPITTTLVKPGDPSSRESIATTSATYVEVNDAGLNTGTSSRGFTSTSSLATDIWSRVYETELKVLRDMGFTDVNTIIPLLREHVGMPVSRNPDMGGQPSAEGMQRVVIQLLGQSMTA